LVFNLHPPNAEGGILGAQRELQVAIMIRVIIYKNIALKKNHKL